MTIKIDFNIIEDVHLNICLAAGVDPKTQKIGNINLDADDDSECLPLDHYDETAIADFLRSELKCQPTLTPRMPRSVTGRFRDENGKYLALSDRNGVLLAVYRIHCDGSMDRIHRVPPPIIAAYN
jgi:hypothetical protein